jgi:hypothetical protein
MPEWRQDRKHKKNKNVSLLERDYFNQNHKKINFYNPLQGRAIFSFLLLFRFDFSKIPLKKQNIGS